VDATTTSLINELRGKIADLERLKQELPANCSDSEIRRFQLDSCIRGAEREISALEANQRGERNWPNERGPRT
jgi:hypothetical protein